MTHARCAALLIFATLGHPALASEALATKQGCLACHAVASRVMGPAYRDVAAKYAKQPGAEDQLVTSIRQGGSGKWGEFPMPPQPNVSEADARKLAKWILAGAR